MSVAMARGVLFLALMVMLPLPFYLSGWVLLTPGFVLMLVIEHWTSVGAGLQPLSLLGLILQLGISLLVCAGLAFLYGLCSSPWPVKFRGSILGITIMTGLVLLSTWPVYDGFPMVNTGLSFLELYHH